MFAGQTLTLHLQKQGRNGGIKMNAKEIKRKPFECIVGTIRMAVGQKYRVPKKKGLVKGKIDRNLRKKKLRRPLENP